MFKSLLFNRKQLTLGKGKIWKQDKKKLLLNDYVIKNNVDVIILIKWLMLAFFLKSKDVFYQVSSDLSEVNGFYNSFSDEGQKAPLPFKSSKKPAFLSY